METIRLLGWDKDSGLRDIMEVKRPSKTCWTPRQAKKALKRFPDVVRVTRETIQRSARP